MKNAPAFQFYPSDWLADARVQMLTTAQEGIYIRLLAYCWREGSLPPHGTAIALLCKRDSDYADIEFVCNELFVKTESGFVHKRLEIEREKQQETRQKRSDSGRLGAKNRWEKSSKNSDSKCHSFAINLPMAKNGSSSSSSSSNKVHVPENDFSEQKPKNRKSKSTLTSNPKSPIRTGCEYFRASDAEIESAKRIYTERGYNLDWLPPAQQAIEDWLADGATTNAIRARKQDSHYRRLWADWVIERADKASRGFKRESQIGLSSEEADKKVAEMNAQLAAKNLQKQGINIGALTKNVRNQTRGKSLDRERERRRSDLRNQVLLESGSGVPGTVSKIS